VDRGFRYFWNTSFKTTKLSFLKTTFQKIILQVLKKLDFIDVACRPHQLFVPKSQCHNSFSNRQIEDLTTMETTEQVVIPDPEVVPERAHSSKFSGKVLQVFQHTKFRELNPKEKKIYYMGLDKGKTISKLKT
jgi:plasmid maintenance system killer protein